MLQSFAPWKSALKEGKSVNGVAKTFKVHGITIYRLANAIT
jgi:hypothetical protein